MTSRFQPLTRKFRDLTAAGAPTVTETLSSEMLEEIVKEARELPELAKSIKLFWAETFRYPDRVIASDHFMPVLETIVRKHTRYDSLFVWDVLNLFQPHVGRRQV